MCGSNLLPLILQVQLALGDEALPDGESCMLATKYRGRAFGLQFEGLYVGSTRDRSSTVRGTPSMVYTDTFFFHCNSMTVTIVIQPIMHLHIVVV